MSDQITYVTGRITRWVSDEPIPGIVEMQIADGDGRLWAFVDKPPIFDESGALGRAGPFPVEVEIACTVIDTADGSVTISTAEPWGLETVDGVSTFTLQAGQIHERFAPS